MTRSELSAEPAAVLGETLDDADVRLYHSDNHMENFLQCLRTGQDPICPVEAGHRSNTICVLTHLSMKLARKLHWDPENEQIRNDAEANSMLDYDHRAPWTI